MADPPLASVPPVCVASARHPFPALRPDLLKWGCGGESVDDLLARAEGHVRGLPGWDQHVEEAGWVQTTVREWLFRRLFDRHVGELSRRVRAR